MSNDMSSFGDLLRTWRERLAPAEAGVVPVGGRRRAKGLRREELAALAGTSVDYVVRLEQGRSLSPSAQVVAALARALRLDRTETELLYRAANQLPPGPSGISDRIPPTAQRMIARMADLPLAVFTVDWTVLTSTPSWCALFDLPSVTEQPGQNLIVKTFVEGPRHVTVHGGFEKLERELVADLRRSAAAYGDDPRFRALVASLRARSPRFGELWDEGRAAAHEGLLKTVHHPLVGDITLNCDVLTFPDSDIKLMVYTAATGSRDAERLERLRADTERADPEGTVTRRAAPVLPS